MNIEINSVSHSYNKSKIKTLDNISTTISPGIYGLLGPNGAGKTTFLKILATLMPLSHGSVVVDNIDLAEKTQLIRRKIGYLPQRFEFFENLTTYEMLDYIAILKGIDSGIRDKIVKDIIYKFNLLDKENERIRTISGGMKQRLAIAQALIGDPDIVILDEPTVGLDPAERLRFRNIISEIQENKIIIISTHIISDISALCDNIGIMKQGKIIYSGKIDNLLKELEGKVFVENCTVNANIDRKKYPYLISLSRKKGLLELRYIDNKKTNAKECEPTLEDAYFYKMNDIIGDNNERTC